MKEQKEELMFFFNRLANLYSAIKLIIPIAFEERKVNSNIDFIHPLVDNKELEVLIKDINSFMDIYTK